MKSKRFLLSAIAMIVILAFLTSVCFAATAEKKRKPESERTVVAVGSYGGYWGLNDWFIGLLSQYFTVAQMQMIDRQIQNMTGIAGLSYNYCPEGGSGYFYNNTTDTWTSTSSRVGKHYGAIYDMGFFIDVSSGDVLTTFSSREVESSSNYANMVGKKIKLDDTTYQVVGARNWSPIILDLKGSGVPDTNRNIWTPHAPAFFGERTAHFDLSGDNRIEYCEWLGSTDGLLVKPNPDGTVTDAENLFGTAGGYRDGYEKMSVTLDSNRDGWVSGKELQGLCIWRDLDGNGKCGSNEIAPIESYGIVKISTSHKNFNSTYYAKNGTEQQTWDWWPSGYELIEI